MKAAKLSTFSNKKLEELAKELRLPNKIRVFGLPAAKTCPSAKDCKKTFKRTGSKKKHKCFGLAGAYLWPMVKAKYEWRLKQSRDVQFVNRMVSEIKRGRSKNMRLHDIGDFYNEAYLWKWVKIMEACDDVTFWAYTKEVEMFKRLAEYLPNNFHYVFSYGGEHDELIDQNTDRFSETLTEEEGKRKGYVNLTENEMRITDRKLSKFYTVAH